MADRWYTLRDFFLGMVFSIRVSGLVLAGVGRLAALARHTIVAGATIKPVPGQRKGEG